MPEQNLPVLLTSTLKAKIEHLETQKKYLNELIENWTLLLAAENPLADFFSSKLILFPSSSDLNLQHLSLPTDFQLSHISVLPSKDDADSQKHLNQTVLNLDESDKLRDPIDTCLKQPPNLEGGLQNTTLTIKIEASESQETKTSNASTTIENQSPNIDSDKITQASCLNQNIGGGIEPEAVDSSEIYNDILPCNTEQDVQISQVTQIIKPPNKPLQYSLQTSNFLLDFPTHNLELLKCFGRLHDIEMFELMSRIETQSISNAINNSYKVKHLGLYNLSVNEMLDFRVLERINQLKFQKKWSSSQIHQHKAVPRQKTHWDHLLDEMKFVYTDINFEKKFKKATLKAVSKITDFENKSVPDSTQKLDLFIVPEYTEKIPDLNLDSNASLISNASNVDKSSDNECEYDIDHMIESTPSNLDHILLYLDPSYITSDLKNNDIYSFADLDHDAPYLDITEANLLVPISKNIINDTSTNNLIDSTRSSENADNIDSYLDTYIQSLFLSNFDDDNFTANADVNYDLFKSNPDFTSIPISERYDSIVPTLGISLIILF
ncbi:hypothetical protein BB561_001201 [Smittium simulii]|uniref:HSA domain-containing protein n=1 Tax=Smittium simulii TaxID=133385 RepID=A0A2T9YVN9_9FUNG|nr:hypothetical protein BB561_001201 [Smittium simulii]